MVEAREGMIEKVIMEVGRSDSGNTSSGIKSDLDQTFGGNIALLRGRGRTERWIRSFPSRKNVTQSPAIPLKVLIPRSGTKSSRPSFGGIQISSLGFDFSGKKRSITVTSSTPAHVDA